MIREHFRDISGILVGRNSLRTVICWWTAGQSAVDGESVQLHYLLPFR